MTTAAKRAKKKANRVAARLEKLEKLGLLLEEADAFAGLSDDEVAEVNVKQERLASEKAAAMQALSAAKKLKKRLAKSD